MTFSLATVRSSAFSVVETYRAANPALIRHAHTTRPAGFSDLPAVYVGDVRTQLFHDSGTRRWAAEVDVVLVDNVAVNEEAMARLDITAMALVDAFTDQPHAFGDNTVGEPIGVASLTEEVNGVPYEMRVVTIGRIYFMEGR